MAEAMGLRERKRLQTAMRIYRTAPGESAVEAVRRQLLDMIEARDPSVGLHSEPFARRIRTVVMATPVLRERAYLLSEKGARELADLLTEETGDTTLALIAAATLTAARQALVEEHHLRIDAGETVDEVAADAALLAERAFALVEGVSRTTRERSEASAVTAPVIPAD